VGVSCQRFTVTLFTRRALAHVQQTRLEESDGADFGVARGESGRPEDVALTNGANANLPLALAQRRQRRAFSHALGRYRRHSSRRSIDPGAGFGAAHLPRVAELVDGFGYLTRLHAQVIAPTPVEVAAQSAQPVLERRWRRHLQETFTVPQQFHS